MADDCYPKRTSDRTTRQRMVLPDLQTVLSLVTALAVLQLVRHALGEAPPALLLSATSFEDTLVDRIQVGVVQVVSATYF